MDVGGAGVFAVSGAGVFGCSVEVGVGKHPQLALRRPVLELGEFQSHVERFEDWVRPVLLSYSRPSDVDRAGRSADHRAVTKAVASMAAVRSRKARHWMMPPQSRGDSFRSSTRKSVVTIPRAIPAKATMTAARVHVDLRHVLNARHWAYPAGHVKIPLHAKATKTVPSRRSSGWR